VEHVWLLSLTPCWSVEWYSWIVECWTAAGERTIPFHPKSRQVLLAAAKYVTVECRWLRPCQWRSDAWWNSDRRRSATAGLLRATKWSDHVWAGVYYCDERGSARTWPYVPADASHLPGCTCFMAGSSKYVYCSCIFLDDVRCVMRGRPISSYALPQSVRVHMYVTANSSASAVVLFAGSRGTVALYKLTYLHMRCSSCT
jgi:hypothetical protein